MGSHARRVPIASVEIKLQGQWLPLKRTVNNQWPYYNTNGPWQGAFPIPVRVTSVTGETIEDAITGVKGNQGTKQFTEVSGSVRARWLLPLWTCRASAQCGTRYGGSNSMLASVDLQATDLKGLLYCLQLSQTSRGCW